jgi:hypothetical protein
MFLIYTGRRKLGRPRKIWNEKEKKYKRLVGKNLSLCPFCQQNCLSTKPMQPPPKQVIMRRELEVKFRLG